MKDLREDLLEKLAELEHEQWVEWAKNLMKNEKLSQKRVDRWNSYFFPYESLNEESGATDDWMFLENDVPALTWETGYLTDRGSIKKMADTASVELTKLLLVQE